MSAFLFDQQIHARLVRGGLPVLWIGIVDQTREAGGTGIRLILCDANGGLSLADLTDIVLDFRYEYIPRRGAKGWTDYYAPDELAAESALPSEDDDDT